MSDEKISKRNNKYAILAVKNATKNYGKAAYAAHLISTHVKIRKKKFYFTQTVADVFEFEATSCAVAVALRAKFCAA